MCSYQLKFVTLSNNIFLYKSELLQTYVNELFAFEIDEILNNLEWLLMLKYFYFLFKQ